MSEISINVLAFEDEDGLWVAQCVEYDIVATAESLKGLLKAFERAVAANVCVNADLGKDGLDGIPAAPDHVRVLFERAPYGRREKGSYFANSRIKIDDLRLTDAVA